MFLLFSLSPSLIVTGVFGTLVLVAALALCFMSRLFYAALLLFVILLALSCLYVMLGAEFLAVSQIILYVGGILMLILFGIMLTQRSLAGIPQSRTVNLATGLLLSFGLMGVLIYLLYSSHSYFYNEPSVSTRSDLSHAEHIGLTLVTEYAVPFELLSVLLLLALIGATFAARKE